MRHDTYGKAKPLQQLDRTYAGYQGRRLTYFGGCDYFRLSSHPEVLKAMREGLNEYGLNVAASRATTGNHVLYEELERRLASFFGVESAILVSSGYVANLAVAEAIDVTAAFIHERSHSSLQTAVRLLNVKPIPFPGALQGVRGTSRPLVATDGLFAHDGELAPLDRYFRILPAKGLLLVDDAHGAGTLGATGRGTPEVLGVKGGKIIQTITLSKAFGVFGGAILCTRELADRIVAQSRIFIGQTPLPLPLVAAALKSVELLRSNPLWRKRLDRHTAHVKGQLDALGFSTPKSPSPIITFVPSDHDDGVRFSRALVANDVFPSRIRYPGGPRHGYFRFAMSSEHSTRQLEALVNAFRQMREAPAARRSRRRLGEG